MHCSSFSKSLAPGYRVGWVAAGRQATAVQRLKLMTTLSAATPSQQALSDHLAQGGYDRHLPRTAPQPGGTTGDCPGGRGQHFRPAPACRGPRAGTFYGWNCLPR